MHSQLFSFAWHNNGDSMALHSRLPLQGRLARVLRSTARWRRPRQCPWYLLVQRECLDARALMGRDLSPMSIQGTRYGRMYKIYPVLFKVYTIRNIPCTVSGVFLSLYHVHNSLELVNCTLYNKHSIIYSVYCFIGRCGISQERQCPVIWHALHPIYLDLFVYWN